MAAFSWFTEAITSLLGRAFAYSSTITIRVSGENYYVSDSFVASKYAGGTVKMPATWTAAALGFKIRMPGDDTFRVWKYWDATSATMKYVSIGDSSTKPTAAIVYTLPAEFYGCVGDVQLWSHDGAGSDVDQTAERAFILGVKG